MGLNDGYQGSFHFTVLLSTFGLTFDNGFFPFLRQMTSLEDDAYSFGFILLEALVGPSLAASREIFLLKEMVCAEMYTLFTLDSCHTWQIPEILEISIQIEQVFSPLIL